MYEESDSRLDPNDALAQRTERLYQRVLSLVFAPVLKPALGEVLRLLAEVTRCELVYLEIPASDDTAEYWLGHAMHALPPGQLRSRVSRDLLRRAITEREIVEAPVSGAASRWREATVVLCTPIDAVLPIGALYVESTKPLDEVERGRVVSIAHQLALVWRMTSMAAHQPLPVQLRALRETRVSQALGQHGGIARAARVLGVSRTYVYRVLGVTGRDTEAEDLYSNDADSPDVERNETQIVSDRRAERRNAIARRKRS